MGEYPRQFKQNKISERKPLRHGWGGNLKLRDQILKERHEEVRESFELAQHHSTQGKYSFAEEQEVVFDVELFEQLFLMDASSK